MKSRFSIVPILGTKQGDRENHSAPVLLHKDSERVAVATGNFNWDSARLAELCSTTAHGKHRGSRRWLVNQPSKTWAGGIKLSCNCFCRARRLRSSFPNGKYCHFSPVLHVATHMDVWSRNSNFLFYSCYWTSCLPIHLMLQVNFAQFLS